MLIHSFPMRLLGMLVGRLGMLKSLPGKLLPGLVILLVMGYRGTAMRVGSDIVQLGGALMILVMRSVVVASGH
jgi:hypothetical protein